ncbi:MAG: amino acid aminotransferase, partial [Chitinophagaceae bacterium]
MPFYFWVPMAKWVFLNNDFVEEEMAFLHFRDLSFQRGYGIFDFLRLVGNKPLFLAHHLDRFFFSAREMHLSVPFDRANLQAVIFNLIQKNNLPESGIRLSLTGGYSEDGFSLGKSNFLISQHQFTPPTDEQRKAGIKLVSYPYQR